VFHASGNDFNLHELYTGTIDANGEMRFVRLRFSQENGVFKGDMEDPESLSSQPLKSVRISGDQIQFAIPVKDKEITCSGKLLSGSMTSDAGSECVLRLVATPAYADQKKFEGAYRFSDGKLVGITSLADFPQLTYCDYQSGMWRDLFHRGGGHFTAGTGMSSPLPLEFSIDVSDNGFRKSDASEKTLTAKKINFREEPMTWINGDARLAGTLILPEGESPFPAVVLTQMSSNASRDAYRLYAYFFASHGIAALIYDRRGIGESKGDTEQSGMIELAQDAVEAVHALQKMTAIDGKRIGTWGHSQGGWIAPYAAAQSADVAFVISQSGPAVSAAEQEIYRVENNARDAGLTDAEVQAAVHYERLLMNWVKTGEGRDEIVAISKTSAAERWARFVELRDSLPDHPSLRSLKFWHLDPAPELAKVRVPILAIYGSRDSFVPVEKSVSILRQALAKAGNQQATIAILPDAAHGMWATKRDTYRELTTSPGFHKDYWPTLLTWLRKQNLAHN
jgi:dienelactone hydrolase